MEDREAGGHARWLRVAYAVVSRITGLLAYPVLWLIAVREGRRSPPAKPRLFWGTIPMINMKYHSLAMRRLGFSFGPDGAVHPYPGPSAKRTKAVARAVLAD